LSARALLLGVALLAAACAPRVQVFGPPNGPPELSDAAFVTADGKSLPMRAWAAAEPRAVILALHGFNDYSNAFDAPAQWWQARGITTYAIDQRGFGDGPEPGIWGGGQAMAHDARSVLAVLRGRHPATPLFLLGDSMGGAVAILAMAGEAPPADGLILVAPAVWGGSQMNPVFRASIWLAAHTTPWNYATGGSLKRQPSDNIAMLRALGRDPRVIKRTRVDSIYGLTRLMGAAQEAADRIAAPTLVLYGDRDEIVPAGPVKAMVGRLDAPYQLITYPDGYHMLLRDLQAERVWRDIANWIGRQRVVARENAAATSSVVRR
jgi:alpha-beta hydrolase superfamily lysophospholipase